jgi:raffinose/stachyose/melibiose transport system substrate-binding protein
MRGLRWRYLAVLSLVALAVGASTTTASHAVAMRAQPQAPITLTYWWWAESDVPGADKWMQQTIALFQKAHPTIQIKLDIQSTDALISNFQAAAAAHKGPDLATQWATIPVLSQAWANAIASLSDYVPKSEIAHWVSTAENVYAGKVWGAPLYLIGIPIIYNKTLFRKAGLDPNNPPQTFAQFLNACAKLKAKGILPFALGNKDAAGGAWFWSTFGKGSLNSVDDIKRAVLGKTHFTDPQFTNWLSALQSMIASGYISSDVASVDLNNGFAPFARGQAGMTFGTDAYVVGYAKTMGEKNIGVFRAPPIGSGKLGPWYDATQSSSEMITSWSPHKQEAAMFLMFMHSPERLKALYDQTGAFPADNRFPLDKIKDPLQRQLLKWDLTLPNIWAENFVPTQLDTNGVRIAGQTVTSGGTAQAGAQLWERTARQWRASNPADVKNFTSWVGIGH